MGEENLDCFLSVHMYLFLDIAYDESHKQNQIIDIVFLFFKVSENLVPFSA